MSRPTLYQLARAAAFFIELMEKIFPHLEKVDGYLGSDAAMSVLQEGRRYQLIRLRQNAPVATRGMVAWGCRLDLSLDP